jgi:thiol-disulfide isomerase/thioredoxin
MSLLPYRFSGPGEREEPRSPTLTRTDEPGAIMRLWILIPLCALSAACQRGGASRPNVEPPEEETMYAHPAASVDAPLAADSYACRRCGRVLFRADEVLHVRPLWDLGEERNEVYVLRSASGLPGLRRYDASLHEGWYCCRFALMRMIVDKFGTGDHLLAYTSNVVRVPAGQVPRPEGQARTGQIRVTAADFDQVVGADHGDHLSVVKLSATWCPPCRMVDAAIARIDGGGGLPDVRFYEADVDADPALGQRFEVRSLPTLRFWYRGQPLEVQSASVATANGAMVGGITQRALAARNTAVAVRSRAGRRQIDLP